MSGAPGAEHCAPRNSGGKGPCAVGKCPNRRRKPGDHPCSRASRPAPSPEPLQRITVFTRGSQSPARPSSNGGGPEMMPERSGGADRPPQSAAKASDVLTVDRRLRSLRRYYNRLSRQDVVDDLDKAMRNTRKRILTQFKKFHGDKRQLEKRSFNATKADQAYCVLHKMARQAEKDGERKKSGTIREALHEIDKRAVKDLQALYTEHEMAKGASTQATPRPPAALAPTGRSPSQFDWITAHRQLHKLTRYSRSKGSEDERKDFIWAYQRIAKLVRKKFRSLDGKPRRPASAEPRPARQAGIGLPRYRAHVPSRH